MKVLDVNLLLYAVNEDAPLHQRARAWLEEALSGSETVAFTWAVLLAFLRLSTRSLIFPDPLSVERAFRLVESWLDQPCAVILHPTGRHLAVLEGLLRPLGAAGNLTSDAHLAAIAIEHGADLCSCDADFARFSGVRWHNPLA